ncbi:hypothetical protein [Nocardioides pocheonensis]|uniref:hypothetical protein n=1 Tax=Nocardioides pocheonensis TaxID=661485 RepID=UPI001608D357|nr:hypothetical protein [Nocardioides pocheonensis]
MGDEQHTPNGGDHFNFATAADSVRARLLAARAMDAPMFPDEAAELPEPAPDQIWRARWEMTALAVIIITNPDDDHVRVAAVTFDPDLADSTATVTPASGTTIGTPAVLWLDAAHTIPLATLDAHLGNIRTPSPERTLVPDELLHYQSSPTKRTNDGVMRASVIDDLKALTFATWVPETGGNITQLLANVKNNQVSEALDLSPADALQIKRGQRPLQPDEATKLAPLTGHSAEELVAAASKLPPAVIHLFNTPAVRARITKYANATGADETTTRRECAYGAYAAAARATGRTDDNGLDQWRQRINQYLDTHLPQAE